MHNVGRGQGSCMYEDASQLSQQPGRGGQLALTRTSQLLIEQTADIHLSWTMIGTELTIIAM